MNILNGYINQILLVLLLAFFGFLGAQAKGLYKRYVNNEVKQAVCRTAVRFVEQVYKDLHGEDKLHAAMKKASEILLAYGISISEAELIAMIEAAVNEFNNAFGNAGETCAAEKQRQDGNPNETNASECTDTCREAMRDHYVNKH